MEGRLVRRRHVLYNICCEPALTLVPALTLTLTLTRALALTLALALVLTLPLALTLTLALTLASMRKAYILQSLRCERFSQFLVLQNLRPVSGHINT